VAKILRDIPWEAKDIVPARKNANTAQKEIGFPPRLWLRISSDHDILISHTPEEQFRFFAGLAVGWREAKIRFDKKGKHQ